MIARIYFFAGSGSSGQTLTIWPVSGYVLRRSAKFSAKSFCSLSVNDWLLRWLWLFVGGLKIPWPQGREGSSPSSGSTVFDSYFCITGHLGPFFMNFDRLLLSWYLTCFCPFKSAGICCLPQEQGQRHPLIEHIRDRLAQTAVGFDPVLRGFLFFIFRGGLTISDDGSLEELEEFFESLATLSVSSVTCFSRVAMRSSRCLSCFSSSAMCWI